MWLSFQVDSVDEAYLSFCQFQGFWFWFQHQGEGEEDEEEEACGENHHDVGVPWSLLSTGTRVKNTHTKYMHCLRFTPQNNEEIFPTWTFSWIGDKVRSFPNLFLSIQKKRHRDKLFQCNQSYYLWLSCFTASNLLLFASLSFSLILFKDSQDDIKETQSKNIWLKIPVQCPSGVFFLHPHDQRTISLPIYHGDSFSNRRLILTTLTLLTLLIKLHPLSAAITAAPIVGIFVLSCSANASTQLQKHKYKYTNTVVGIYPTVLQRIRQLEDFRTSSSRSSTSQVPQLPWMCFLSGLGNLTGPQPTSWDP